MVTKKKNLLQRLRIVFTALIAVLGFAAVMSDSSAASQRQATYGVLSTDATYYYVTAATGDCSGTSGVCSISNVAPDSQGRIRKDMVAPENINPGEFSQSGLH